MADIFNSIETATQGIYKDKGSSFISYIYPLIEENNVKKILLNLKKEHPKARHICYAYRFGPDQNYHRIYDDGEPNGTAGKPILNQLKSYQLENVFIAVARYFGGTLLGVSGLINAYKHAALDAILHSRIISKRRNVYFYFQCAYSIEKQLSAFISTLEGIIIKKIFTENVEIEVAFPLSGAGEIIKALNHTQLKMQWKEKIDCTLLFQDQF